MVVNPDLVSFPGVIFDHQTVAPVAVEKPILVFSVVFGAGVNDPLRIVAEDVKPQVRLNGRPMTAVNLAARFVF